MFLLKVGGKVTKTQRKLDVCVCVWRGGDVNK